MFAHTKPPPQEKLQKYQAKRELYASNLLVRSYLTLTNNGLPEQSTSPPRGRRAPMLHLPLPFSVYSYTLAISICLRVGFAASGSLAPPAGLHPPFFLGCNAYFAGFLPLLPTIDVKSATNFVRVNILHPSGVSLAVNRSSP